MEKNQVFDLILTLLENSDEAEKGKRNVTSFWNNTPYSIHNCDYLLNQVLRQYGIRKDHYLISEQAQELWNQLGQTDDIRNYYYQEKVTCLNDNVAVKMYKGASSQKNERTLMKDEVFTYKDVFHNEHIVPIKMIMDRLNHLKRNGLLTYEALEEVLQSIYVCRLTKEEDRALNNRSDRFENHIECYEKIYKPKGIIIEELEM